MVAKIVSLGAVAAIAVGGWVAFGLATAPRVLAIPAVPSAVNTLTFAPEVGTNFDYTLKSLETGKVSPSVCTCRETLAGKPTKLYLSARNEGVASGPLLSHISLDETPREIVMQAELWVQGEGFYHAEGEALMGQVQVKASTETVLYAQHRIVHSLPKSETAGALDVVVDALTCDSSDPAAGRIRARLSGVFIPSDEQHSTPGVQDASIAVPFSFNLDQEVRFDGSTCRKPT